MNMDLFYALGGIVSGLLLVYLVYALFRAEEF
jgi:K+-transporting ATPase KdpF subunit